MYVCVRVCMCVRTYMSGMSSHIHSDSDKIILCRRYMHYILYANCIYTHNITILYTVYRAAHRIRGWGGGGGGGIELPKILGGGDNAIRECIGVQRLGRGGGGGWWERELYIK